MIINKKNKSNGTPAFAGVTVFLKNLATTKFVMPAKAGIPFFVNVIIAP